MIFIRKDSLVLTSIFICLSIIAISLYEQQNKANNIETVTLPVSNKVIVIDAGHGGTA